MGKFLLAAIWKLASSAVSTSARVGEKVVGAVEKGVGLFRPGAALPPAVAGTAKIVAGVSVVGAGVGGVAGGVTEGTGGAMRDSALAMATEYVPALVPDKYKVYDSKSFGQRFGEGFLPGFANGAINGATWLPVTLWNFSRGAWNYVAGNTTKDNMGMPPPKPAAQTAETSKETKPMTYTAETSPATATAPPPTTDPAATEAAKAAQDQAAKAAELDAAKKKAEAAKQAEADKLAQQKAANNAELEKAKEEKAKALAQQKGSYEETTQKIKDAAGNINIWDGIYKITEWVNQPGVPKLFRQCWNWAVGMLNTDAGRSIMLGLGALKGIGTGLGLVKDIVTGKASRESLATDAFELGIAGALVGAGVQRPTGAPAANEDDYGSPPAGNDGQSNRGRGRGDDRQQPRDDNEGYGNRLRLYRVNAEGNVLNQDASSTAAFRNASGPAANGAAPVYAYGTAAPGNNGQSLADDFNNKGGSLMVTNVVPPVTTIPDYEKTPKNWLTYDIGGTGS